MVQIVSGAMFMAMARSANKRIANSTSNCKPLARRVPNIRLYSGLRVIVFLIQKGANGGNRRSGLFFHQPVA